MNDDIINKMFNGVPVSDFIAYYLWAVIGMLIVFGISVGTNANKSGWSWPEFWKGWKRIVTNLLLIAAGIVFWPNISSMLFQSDTPVELNMWSAFGIGLGLDRLRSWIKSTKQKK